MATAIETDYPHKPVDWRWDVLPDTPQRISAFEKLPKPAEPVKIAVYGPEWRFHCPYCRTVHQFGAEPGDVASRVSHCWSRWSPWNNKMLELHRVGDELPATPVYPWSKRKQRAS